MESKLSISGNDNEDEDAGRSAERKSRLKSDIAFTDPQPHSEDITSLTGEVWG